MNTNFHISKSTGVLIVAGILVAIAVSYLVIRNKTPEATVSITGGPATETEATFVTLAGELDSIVFNTAILEDPRFLSLIDIHRAVIPEESGRPDPFAPLGRQ